MPKEKSSLLGMIRGDEPGLIARLIHTVSGEDEGVWGENCIEKLLKNRISGVSFFRNVYVPVEGRTTELDIVMVASSGVYIFESKAYGGKIYGSPEQMKWVQYMGGKKSSFYNPVKQNENHCRHLSKALQIPQNSTFSFIVFENRANLSKVSPLKGDNFFVCNRENLLQLLTNIMRTSGSLLPKETVTAVCLQLEAWSNREDSFKEQHVQQVQDRMFGNACPVCGKKLVTRNGKTGTFIGCTGYPKCKYTREN